MCSSDLQRLTFRQQTGAAAGSVAQRLGRYYLAVLLGLGLQLAVLHGLLAWVLPGLALGPSWGGWPVRLANVAGIGAGTLANFWMSRRFVFR